MLTVSEARTERKDRDSGDRKVLWTGTFLSPVSLPSHQPFELWREELKNFHLFIIFFKIHSLPFAVLSLLYGFDMTVQVVWFEKENGPSYVSSSSVIGTPNGLYFNFINVYTYRSHILVSSFG